MTASNHNRRVACRVTIRGIVQGVGFRPFVYRAAASHRVAGWVLNGDTGVEIHAEAVAVDLAAFLDELRSHPPPAARIAGFAVGDVRVEGLQSFQIRPSEHAEAPTVRISPDLCICADCLRELGERTNHRYGYPYINCTNCGPRYSIVRSLPFDRANTTMAGWQLCPRCREEYENPLDRRYHAQPNACETCGPGFQLCDAGDGLWSGRAAMRRAATLLREGALLAVKGIGGYHLACDARNEQAVAALRTRKFRREKPFALLLRDLDEAHRLVELTEAHERLLLDGARPIVLAPAREEWPLIAPDNASLGVMLPYAPLHHLLFEHGAPSPLVLTSGNRSSEPIAYRDDEARERLKGVADAYLVGERPIARRVDDSVVAVRCGRPFMVRRSRGYVPAPVCRLPSSRPILALGADLKNAVALVVDGQVFVSQHIGDLDDDESRRAFAETIDGLLAMYEVDPRRLTVAHDLHPQFHSSRFAETLPAARRIAVQHHHAHIASVLAEHGLLEVRVAGVAFDGVGYGGDGTIWGGEFFVGSCAAGFERRAWLRPARMPGADAAARFPVQAAAGFLWELPDLPDLTAPPFRFPSRFKQATALAAKNVRCFVSSSMGRLFDAVAALAGFTDETTFEGQAAIWLEHQARRCRQAPYEFANLDPRALLQAVMHDRLAGRSASEISAAFHAAVAAATAEKIIELCAQENLGWVALSGGVFQNELLWNLLLERLEQFPRIRVASNASVPVNDGGICLGQAAIAARL